MHAVVHDAFGYLLNCHKCGPGYNYLDTYFTLTSTANPMCCQSAGIWEAYWVLREHKMYGEAGRNRLKMLVMKEKALRMLGMGATATTTAPALSEGKAVTIDDATVTEE